MSDAKPLNFKRLDQLPTTPDWLESAGGGQPVRTLLQHLSGEEPANQQQSAPEEPPLSAAPPPGTQPQYSQHPAQHAQHLPAAPSQHAAAPSSQHPPPYEQDPHAIDGAAPEEQQRPLSRLPPPPKTGSLIPGARSNPPPANDAAHTALRERAEAFANAAIELGIARAATLTVLEGQLLDLAIEIASAVIEREVEREPQLHAALARAALSSLGGDARSVTLRSSPDGFPIITAAMGGEEIDVRGVHVQIVADDSLPGLGCVVDGENVRIDASVSERLRAVRRAFEEERRKTMESVE